MSDVLHIALHKRNIVRICHNKRVTNATILKMCFDFAVVKYEDKQYRVPYAIMDEVVGHELLMPYED